MLNGVVQYLVKWRNYSDNQNTWEPMGNLDCSDLIAEYEFSRRVAKILGTRIDNNRMEFLIETHANKNNAAGVGWYKEKKLGNCSHYIQQFWDEFHRTRTSKFVYAYFHFNIMRIYYA
ncbi:chromobox protein 5-like protein [Leptotrombidium deliense]|uniref:Chromobox protein 5-like protein n=1 Tax=Leptotrombidium deliense TaxID=299467 RepID=A0A443RWJ8_9ACAR|nr:chromobox protein 5-like protein [Leptotrombidium deliense]